MTDHESYYIIYRTSSIGIALADALDEMVSSGRLEPQLANKVMQSFDKGAAQVLARRVRARIPSMRGRLDTYNDIEGAFTLVVKDVRIKLGDNTEMEVEKMKIHTLKAIGTSGEEKEEKGEVGEGRAER